MSNERLSRVLQLIDNANSADPDQIQVGDQSRPAALVYGERMSAMLAAFRADAGELLKIAARAQHIERWTSPRSDYPDGRAGYLQWRTNLKVFHAKRVGMLMEEAGYHPDEIARVGVLLRKERLKRDDEVQALEDVICLVFLKYYAAEFIARHDDEKVTGILAKTARKMSSAGINAAMEIELPERLGRLLTTALAA